MSDNKQIIKQFTTLSECIKLGMSISGIDSTHLQPKFKYYALQCVNELEWDVLKKFTYKFLGVDNTTQTAKLPDDFVQWVRVGVLNQGNEILDLTFDPNLAFKIGSDCTAADNAHCDCGCSDPVCAAISNVATTTEVITINETNYNKTTSVCTKSDGTIAKRICEPLVTNPSPVYAFHFDILIAGMTGISNMNYTKNNVVYNVGDVSDSTVFTSVWTALGWTNANIGGGITRFSHTTTTDYYTSWSVTISSVITTTSITKDSQSNPTPTVSTVCHDETICNVEVKDCGCIVPTDTVVNTLQSMGILALEFSQRYLNNLGWLQTFFQPLSYLGYFNIDIYQRVIQLDPYYQRNSVYLEYITSDDVDSGDFLVPVFAKNAIAFYCKWLFSESRDNVSNATKERNLKKWLSQKSNLKKRLDPIRLDQLLQVMRVPVRP